MDIFFDESSDQLRTELANTEWTEVKSSAQSNNDDELSGNASNDESTPEFDVCLILFYSQLLICLYILV
jgi:hypothetical protein